MKKVILFFLISLFSITIQAQTFVCTDFDYRGSELTPQKVQKEKIKYLGSKATLTFYDKSLKISAKINGEIVSVILDKNNNNEYQATEKHGKNITRMVLKLNKWVEYIRSFSIEFYKNYSLEGTITYKRD